MKAVEIARYQLKGGMVVDNKRVKAELLEIAIPGSGAMNKWILNIDLVDQFHPEIIDPLTSRCKFSIYYQDMKYENFQWHCRAVAGHLACPTDLIQLQHEIWEYINKNTREGN